MKYSLGVTSGKVALRVALAAIGIKPGDEVITQSFTFVATIEAIVESGGIPVIANVNENLDMDINDLKQKLQTKQMYNARPHASNPANMKSIIKIAKQNKLHIVEDVAWGLEGQFTIKNLVH